MSKIEAIIRKTNASLLIARHKKHADISLYQVLANCLEICEVCIRDKREQGVLIDLIKKLPLVNGNKRQYVEKSSDVYQHVCRYIFHGEEHTANTNRYAICLREAAKQDVSSKDIIEELLDGGINRFYLARPNLGEGISTKCIRLDRAIYHHKAKVISLKLKRKANNTYEVLTYI